ncbi:MAG: hypothetical protein N0C88_11760 [Candidatus Thiodiazotropha lotti]|uniref:Uncharacterized protein n=1 Tax=Candidatus Thiodiazotropha lotti TaxID=2792787 RepID=A0A9E4K4Y3_9GAMM|nr:hypothetical protein [Candidatus Thiodiazotropha lotti]MCW4203978.1 hypothetical protein [Candidatus Thiodiazotropha lotti]
MSETMTVQEIVTVLAPKQQTPDSLLDTAISKITEYKHAGVDLDLARAVSLAGSEEDKLTMDIKQSISKAVNNKSINVSKLVGNCLDDWEIKIDTKFSEWIKRLQIDIGISVPSIFSTEGNQKTSRKISKLELRHETVKKVIDVLKKEDPSIDPRQLEQGMKRVIFDRCKKDNISLFAITFETFHSEYWRSDLRKQVLKVKDEEKYKS